MLRCTKSVLFAKKPIFDPHFASQRSDFIKIFYSEPCKPLCKVFNLGVLIQHLDSCHSHIVPANPHEDYKRGFQFIAAALPLQRIRLLEKLVVLLTCHNFEI